MKLIPLALALALSAGLAHAYPSVNWGNDLLDPVPLFQNDGSLFDSTFTFQLGTFDSFTPTSANTDQWQSSWKLLDTGNWSAGTQTFGNSFSFNPDGTVNGLTGSATFTAGEQVYLWAFCDNEWVLVTDNVAGAGPNDLWTLPNPAADPGIAVNWNVSTATTPIIGGVNGVQSGTYHSYDPGTNFRLQTAVVPEPGSLSLLFSLVLAAMAGSKRTRSRKA